MNVNDYRYIAHRGLYNNDLGIVENSINAFSEAIEKKIAIELDVRLTLDNHIVVFHDSNLLRITDIDKEVEECTLEELKNLRLLNTNSKIPTLDEVLDLINGQVPLLIEVKNEGKVGLLERLLMKRLENYNGKYIVESFNPLSIMYIKKYYKEVAVGQLLTGDYIRFKELINKLVNMIIKPEFIAYDINYLSWEQKKFCKEKGIYLISWTIKTHDELKKAKALSDGIIFENLKDFNVVG